MLPYGNALLRRAMPESCGPSLGMLLLPRKAILPKIGPIIQCTAENAGLFGDVVDAKISRPLPNSLERHACTNQGFDSPAKERR